jgi:hypothetical protein
MKLRNWLQHHSLKLLAIRDTPQAIAGGVAIGVFFGFTPLFGLKTLLSVAVGWIFGCNLLAAAIAVQLHDILLPFMPFVFDLEYRTGHWLLNRPHVWPEALTHAHLGPRAWRNWTTYVTLGKPMLAGSAVLGIPVALVFFFATRTIVARHQHKKASQSSGGGIGAEKKPRP